MKQQNLAIDLQQGVLPISAAAAHLAALIKQARSTGQPIIITQKGYPTGVILGVETFTALRELAERVEVEAGQSAGVWPLLPPALVETESISVTNYHNECTVLVMFLDAGGTVYRLNMPYRLNGGGRAYTFARADGPEPTLKVGAGEPRRIDSSEAPAFGAWCQVADHHLDR